MVTPSNRPVRGPHLQLSYLLLFFLCPFIISGQTSDRNRPSDATLLEQGKSIERGINGGQKHAYKIYPGEKQYVKIVIEPKEFDVVVRLLAPDGQLIGKIDSDQSPNGAERVELVSDAPGSYELHVAPAYITANGEKGYSIRVVEIRQATTSDIELYRARRLHYEALRLNDDGKFDDSVQRAQDALQIREGRLSSGHEDVAVSLLTLANVLTNKNDLIRAETNLNRAREIYTKSTGINSLGYADVLHTLAGVSRLRGDYEKAEGLYQQAITIKGIQAGELSLTVSNSLLSLGQVYQAVNDFPKAERAFLKGVNMREQLFGSDSPEVAFALNYLGLMYYRFGDYVHAESTLRRAHGIREKTLDKYTRIVGIGLNNLGLAYWRQGEYEKAEATYLKALEIFEKVNGPESDGVANVLTNLGIVAKESGKDYVKAENYYLRALAIFEKTGRGYSENAANTVSSLGLLYRSMGDLNRAESFILRALEINEKVVGPNHQNTVLSLTTLTRIYAAKGDIPQSMEYQRRIAAVEATIIPLNSLLGSERQKIAYFSRLSKPDRNITFLVNLAPDLAAARDLSTTLVLQRKGRIQDALAQNIAQLRQRSTPEDQALFDRLTEINSRLSKAVMSGTKDENRTEYQNRINSIAAERETIESELNRRSAGLVEITKPVTLSDVRSSIPDDAALIEFAAYRPFDWKSTDDSTAYGATRYIVFVIRNREDVQWVEIGEADEIEKLIEQWRTSLRSPLSKGSNETARLIDEKVMRPVRRLTGDAVHLLLSPDGDLNLIPFEALVDENGSYLVERYSISYLTSGRDLLRMRLERKSKSQPLIIADPLFGEPAVEQTMPKRLGGKKRQAKSRRPSTTTTRSITDTYFAPLAGTALEARTIKALFPNAITLSAGLATETSVKQAVAPSLLHFATHGFFLNEEATTHAPATPTSAAKSSTKIENPLLRAGLALAGANKRTGSGDDGILTALEASGLNLWGTKLIVLSACDTGLGEVRNGEGVFGLRRSFTLAGAESMVMSLWPVSDYVTRELMTNYYKNLKKGIGRGESLRKVQLEMLKRPNRRHPFYWASFIQSGEWANLDGRR